MTYSLARDRFNYPSRRQCKAHRKIPARVISTVALLASSALIFAERKRVL
jgi:hypothetical protein